MEENVSVESFFGRDFRKSKSSENVICSQDILKALEELWKLLISCLLNFTAQNILNFEQLIIYFTTDNIFQKIMTFLADGYSQLLEL